MVQFNLLPDIKIQYIRAQRQKHLVVLISVIAVAASAAVIVLLASAVFVVQRKSIADLSRDITSASKELQGTPDLAKMLTVQNQLRELPSLHAEKQAASRLFGYIRQATPADVSMSHLNADFTAYSMSVTGTAKSLETINKFVDTLKFTTYHTAGDPEEEIPAFTNVVLASFSRDSKSASYTVTFGFDPVIFKDTEEVTLTVPNKVTTRLQVERPAALFNGQTQGGN